jgi:hypothetical protein
MDENLKYYKVTGPGVEKDVVLGIKPEQVDETIRRYGERGYTLEETEAPKGAMMIDASMPYTLMPRFDEPVFHGERRVRYDGQCCGRCANRYKRSEFCDNHYHSDRCYRFKLER